ncbi:unnamed protein product [Caenorhabditis brenneri]
MSFPLHKLPINAVLHVLRRMEIYDQLSYSLCSKNTKKNVKGLNLKATKIRIGVFDRIEVAIRFNGTVYFESLMDHHYHFPEDEFSVFNRIDVYIHVVGGRNVEWKIWHFGIQNWLQHLCDVLNHPIIDELIFNDGEIDIDIIKPVQKLISRLPVVELGLCEKLTPVFARKALDSFDYHDELFLTRISFGNHELSRMNKILLKNLWRVCIGDAGNLTVYQLLISNWEEIQLVDTQFTDKDFNLLLRFWIKGSNSRLKYFSAGTVRPLDRNVILKGINCSQIPLDNEEVYRRRDYYYQETRLAGGSKIRRFDGTQAVVVIEDHSFKLIVDI